MTTGGHTRGGLIAFLVRNSVAANLLMLLILIGGAVTAYTVPMEVFAETSFDFITVTVEYRGAAPEEVEDGVCTRIEEAVVDLEAIREMRSTANEGVCTVSLELIDGSDMRLALEDVKARVDAIDTFPDETEKPVIREAVPRRQVVNVAVAGTTDIKILKQLAERVRDEIAALDGITQVELAAVPPYEVSIEVAERDLRRFGLTFDDVAMAVRRSSIDLPGGTIRAASGEILLRTEGQAYRGAEFESLVLRTRGDGTRLVLGDVATIRDGFADADVGARFDGRNAALVQVFRVGEQSATEIAHKVASYVERSNEWMPAGIELMLWQDNSKLLESRLDTLLRNGRAGLVLVLILLALFLRLRLAFWVAVGIGVSFLGTLWVMPVLGATINVISLFAFIVAIGIVVDDTIVVGENIYRHHEMGKDGATAAIDGAREVAVPVIFSVLTTIAAFAALFVVPSGTGKILGMIPVIVIAALVFSLVESLCILPAHLSHLHRKRDRPSPWRRVQERLAAGLDWVISRIYRPVLDMALSWRYTTVAIACAALLITVSAMTSNVIGFAFYPSVEPDNLVVYVTMPLGTPARQTAATLEQIEENAFALQRELAASGHESVFRHVMTTVGEQPFRQRQANVFTPGTASSGHIGEVNVELSPAETRGIAASELVRRWRDITGPIPDAVDVSFVSSLIAPGGAIDIRLSGPDLDQLRWAATELKTELARYPGVVDIGDSLRRGKRELELDVTSEAEACGITRGDLARQVRQAFYGEEAQRIQRGRDDVRVMVRYPERDRQSLSTLQEMRIRTPDGREMPFAVVGRAEMGRGFASIVRTDGRRTVDVVADVDTTINDPNEIIADLQTSFLPRLLAEAPGLSYRLEGQQRDQRETLGGLQRGFLISLFVIYALLAIPFRSYLQPLIVMSAIPFGVIGAIWGHVLLGHTVTILSAFGIVALVGVVVNDSLVMVDFINRAYRAGTPLLEAIRAAGAIRFRPILLTSLTTFVGLLPLILERSLQAQFLIPMAISLAFGVIFATGIILILVPVGYTILEDAKALVGRVLGIDTTPAADPTPHEA